MAFEENDISSKAQGGTEITKRSLAKLIDPKLLENFQIIPSRVREIQDDKIRIYWQHDLPEDPEVNHLKNESSRNRFHQFVFSSNWQLNDYASKIGFPLDERSRVIETPVTPFEPNIQKNSERVDLIYFSTPQRGLEILLPVFEELCKKLPSGKVHLHVYSSFLIYGWVEQDKLFEPLYERCRQHPHITYHGFAPQEQLREALKNADILAYPSIWKETSCRVLIESMSAGLLCVHPNLAALSDTSGNLTSMYQYIEDKNKHANLFLSYLEHAITVVHTEPVQNYLRFQKAYADSRFGIQKIASQWEGLLHDLNEQYPTVESRRAKRDYLVFKTS